MSRKQAACRRRQARIELAAGLSRALVFQTISFVPGGFTKTTGHFAFAISSGNAIELPQGVRLTWLNIVHPWPSANPRVV